MPSVTNSKKAVDVVVVVVVVVVAGVVVIVGLAVTADAVAVGLVKGLAGKVGGRTGAKEVVEGGGGGLMAVVAVGVGVVVEVVVVEVVVRTVGIAVVVVVDRRGAEGDAVVRDIWRTAKSDWSKQARNYTDAILAFWTILKMLEHAWNT